MPPRQQPPAAAAAEAEEREGAPVSGAAAIVANGDGDGDGDGDLDLGPGGSSGVNSGGKGGCWTIDEVEVRSFGGRGSGIWNRSVFPIS